MSFHGDSLKPADRSFHGNLGSGNTPAIPKVFIPCHILSNKYSSFYFVFIGDSVSLLKLIFLWEKKDKKHKRLLLLLRYRKPIYIY